MFGKKNQTTNQVDLTKALTIKGYTPNPNENRAFVFESEGKLIAAKVLNTGGAENVELAAGIAELHPGSPAVAALGPKVILVNSSTARAAKNPFLRKSILALLEMVNGQIFGYDFEAVPVGVGPTAKTDVNAMPDRAWSMIQAGKTYGFSAAKAAQNRQNKCIDRSTKRIVGSFRMQAFMDQIGMAAAGAVFQEAAQASNIPGFGEGAEA